MNLSVKELFDFKIQAEDGEIGSVHDVLFDDDAWTVRYLVVETGTWLFGRKVLVAPVAASEPDRVSKHVPLRLTKEQVKDSPDISADPPLSRDQEMRLNNYYRWPYYWDPGLASFAHETVIAPMGSLAGEATNITPDHPLPATDQRDYNLRSARNLMGYEVHGGGEMIGEVADLLLDGAAWTVPYVVVRMHGMSDDRQVLLPATSVRKLGWPDREVLVDLGPESFWGAPSYDDSVTRDKVFLEKVNDYFKEAVRT
jgi:sporulation protein YlmC with PRC-barrel domain